MPPDPRSGRKGALIVWQVDEITMDRAREEASFAKVQAAIAYLDSAPAGFFTADADGNIEYLNATLAQWLGLDLSEVAGRALKLQEIMSADSAALIAPNRPRAGARARRAASTSIWSRPTAPACRCASCIVCRARARAAALAHALVLSRGPGEAEEAGAAELRFARLFHSAPIAIATVDDARLHQRDQCRLHAAVRRRRRRGPQESAWKAWSSLTAIRRSAARSMRRSPGKA